MASLFQFGSLLVTESIFLTLLRGNSQEQSYPCMSVSIQNMPISHQHITAHAGNPKLDAPLLQGAPHLPAEDRYHSLCSVAHTLPPSMPSELHERGKMTSLFPVL